MTVKEDARKNPTIHDPFKNYEHTHRTRTHARTHAHMHTHSLPHMCTCTQARTHTHAHTHTNMRGRARARTSESGRLPLSKTSEFFSCLAPIIRLYTGPSQVLTSEAELTATYRCCPTRSLCPVSPTHTQAKKKAKQKQGV